MVNSSGLFELLASPELAPAFDAEPWQPARAAKIADTAASVAPRRQRLLRNFMAGSSFPQLASVAREPSYKMPAPGDKTTGWTGNCARRRENPTGWRRPACKHTR